MRRIFRSGEWAAKLPSAGIALKWADILFVGVNSTHNLHAPARRHSDRRRAEVHQPRHDDRGPNEIMSLQILRD
jgi:hypothetical protein